MENLSHAQENELKQIAQEIEAKHSKDTEFGRDLIAGAKQILAHVEGRKILKEYTPPSNVA